MLLHVMESHPWQGLPSQHATQGKTPTDAQLQPLLQPIVLNPGNAASLKRLIFEAQTLVCNEVKIKANKKEDAPTNFAPSEREARIQ